MSVQRIRHHLSLARVQERNFINRLPDVLFSSQKANQAWLVNDILRIWEDNVIMAKKAASIETPKKSEPVPFKGFVNYTLTEDDKLNFGSWDVDDHDLWIILVTCIQAGYKFSCSYNAQNDTFVACLHCNDKGSPNAGFLLSSFAPEWYLAVKSLLYKHEVVLEGNWQTEEVQKQAKWG